MFRTFATWEDAGIFASYMRSEGYFAEILDQGASSLYGPAAIGGIRVLVSEEPLTAMEPPDETSSDIWEDPLHPPAQDSEIARFLRLFVVGCVTLSLVVVACNLLIFLRNTPDGILFFVWPGIASALLLACSCVAMTPLLPRAMRLIREEQDSGPQRFVSWLILAILLPAVFLMV